MGGATLRANFKQILYDSIEVFDVKVGKWKMAEATLPRPMLAARASNIDDSILIFGVFVLYLF